MFMLRANEISVAASYVCSVYSSHVDSLNSIKVRFSPLISNLFYLIFRLIKKKNLDFL